MPSSTMRLWGPKSPWTKTNGPWSRAGSVHFLVCSWNKKWWYKTLALISRSTLWLFTNAFQQICNLILMYTFAEVSTCPSPWYEDCVIKVFNPCTWRPFTSIGQGRLANFELIGESDKPASGRKFKSPELDINVAQGPVKTLFLRSGCMPQSFCGKPFPCYVFHNNKCRYRAFSFVQRVRNDLRDRNICSFCNEAKS